MAKATNVKVDIQNGTERDLYATWTWSKDHVDEYKIRWYYATGDGVWFVGSDSPTDYKQSTYSPPENALKVKFKVKPVSKKRKVNGKETSYWTADWSTEKIYTFKKEPPEVPPVPTLELDGLKLTISVDNVETGGKETYVYFDVVKDDKSDPTWDNKKIKVKTRHASITHTVSAGAEYKARCKAAWGSNDSKWSDYSSNVVTRPATPAKILECRALSPTSVYLDWNKSKTATSYEVQYTTKKSHFDSSSDVQSVTVNDGTNLSHAEILGLETGNTYYFRVRALNEHGESGWTDIKSVTIGREPSAPTTWSSKNTVTVGDALVLYWTHNAEDNSNQERAEVRITADEKTTTHGVWMGNSNSKDVGSDGHIVSPVSLDRGTFELVDGNVLIVDFAYSKKKDIQCHIDLPNMTVYVGNSMDHSWSSDTRVTMVYHEETISFEIVNKMESPLEEEKDGIFMYPVNTGKYADGTKFKWSVRTKGVLNDFSPWSTTRTIDIYAPPTLDVDADELLDQFPYYLRLYAGPDNQKVIGYHVSITATESYYTVDEYGNDIQISAGTEVYSKHFNTDINPFTVELSPSVVNFENNAYYSVNCTVSMNSGLTGSNVKYLKVLFEDEEMFPDVEIGVDKNSASAILRPYCVDGDGNIVDATMSVYRREYDGSFTEIMTKIFNDQYVVDVHPALDYARYRIVAVNNVTGKTAYYDAPGEPIGETAAVIQWDDTWAPFDVTEETEMEQPSYTSTMLKLPYNIDVSESNKVDVSHVEYIGRNHPVAYHGTQVGESQTWNVEIVRSDSETLHALRRLQKWMGIVYVREPSGSGYWATVEVSFTKKHTALTIPVTINITRVEGGM